MPRRKQTVDEREAFRAKVLQTRRKRPVTELKSEGDAFRAHLANAQRKDAEAIARIVHHAIHRLGRDELTDDGRDELVMVADILQGLHAGNRRVAVDATGALLRALLAPEAALNREARPSNVIDLFAAVERRLATPRNREQDDEARTRERSRREREDEDGE